MSDRLSRSQIVLLRSLFRRSGGRPISIERWQRGPSVPLWRRGIVEIWYRQVPDEGSQGPYFSLTISGARLASAFLPAPRGLPGAEATA